MVTKIHPLEIYNNVVNRPRSCFICDPVEGSILYETAHFRVLIDHFPILAGHVMICSKDSLISVANTPIELTKELFDLKDSLSKKVRTINGDCIFYEHGHKHQCLGFRHENQSCEHFLLHCLPVNISIKETLEQKFRSILVNDYQQLHSLSKESENYLYFETTKEEKYFFPIGSMQVEPDLLRTLICNTLGITNRADWKTYQETMLFVKSYELIANFIQWE